MGFGVQSDFLTGPPLIPDICYFFFIRAKFLENRIYIEKTRKLRQNTNILGSSLAHLEPKLQLFEVLEMMVRQIIIASIAMVINFKQLGSR